MVLTMNGYGNGSKHHFLLFICRLQTIFLFTRKSVGKFRNPKCPLNTTIRSSRLLKQFPIKLIALKLFLAKVFATIFNDVCIRERERVKTFPFLFPYLSFIGERVTLKREHNFNIAIRFDWEKFESKNFHAPIGIAFFTIDKPNYTLNDCEL